MQVIFGEEQKNLLGDKFTLLELDTFLDTGMAQPVTAWAVIGFDDINIMDIPTMDNFQRMHSALLSEYRKKNWGFCLEAIGHLKGKWNGKVDSFYEIFEDRINTLKDEQLPDEWNGVIVR